MLKHTIYSIYSNLCLSVSLIGKTTFIETGVLAALLVLVTALAWQALDSNMAKAFVVILCLIILLLYLVVRNFVMDKVVSLAVISSYHIMVWYM